jgi:4-alpha-glucanotransferase
VVGEDLGTVPSEVREAMDQSRMLRSWVLQFEVSEEDPLPDPPESVMASIGTHDLPRFASFWSGRDLDELEASGAQSSAWSARQRTGRDGWRRALTATAAETVTGDPQMGRASDPDALRQAGLLACLDHLADSRARLVTVDLEDLWGERQPVNRPGTGSDVPNWRRRASRALEEIVADPSLTETLAHLDDARRRAGAAGLATTPGGGR